MKKQERQQAYDLISDLASLDEASGLAKERAVLLLWFLRNVVGLDEFDAFDYICDGDDDGGIDALYLEEGQAEDDVETLVIFQSYFPEGPKDVGPNKLDKLITASNHFKTEAALRGFLAGDLEPALRRLIAEFGLLDKLAQGRFADGRLRIRLVYVTMGVLNQRAIQSRDSTNEAEGKGYLSSYDLPRLADIAAVVAAPDSEVDELVINCKSDERLIVQDDDGGNRVVVVPVKASSIVEWDGIEDRKLFALNVRGELRRNRVSRQLDAAIRRETDHGDFLASHNGMTITCDHFDEKRGSLVVTKPSVVNGAQSVIAFWRGEQDAALTDDLQVFVKLVEVKGRPQFASSVSSRSNTQTAVSARNLVANTGPQRRLLAEFTDRFPGVLYEVKYDDSLVKQHSGPRIANDEAAQLLCAVYNQEPWLAVKRTSLFEAENYPRIFNEGIHAEDVVLMDLIKQEANARRDKIPERYRRSWILTRLVVIYLVGQILRADKDLREIISDPAAALADRDQLADDLKRPFSAAILTLKKRQDQRDRDGEDDDFRVDFKNTEHLKELRDQARDAYLTLVEAEALRS
jgi:AIPR protein